MRKPEVLHRQAILVLGAGSGTSNIVDVGNSDPAPAANYSYAPSSISGMLSGASREESWVFRTSFSSVPVIRELQLTQEYRELGEALGELTRLEPGDEWKIDAPVYNAACYVAEILVTNSYPAPQVFNHGPKSVVFNWPLDADNLYLTISDDKVSALISSPERIEQRVDFTLAQLQNSTLILSPIQSSHLEQSIRLLTGAVSDPPELLG